MAEFQDLNPTDASNIGRFPEGMAPSAVNDGARALEGLIARWHFDTNFSVQATVSGSVIQMTANRTSLTLTGTTSNYMADLLMAFTMGSTANPDGCYVNINGIGKIALRDARGNSLSASVIAAGARALITKDGVNDYFRLLMPTTSPWTIGTWTPADASGAGLTLTVNRAVWRRIGDLVFIQTSVTYPATGNASQPKLSGLPFPVPSNGAVVVPNRGTGFNWVIGETAGGTSNVLAANADGSAQANANLSGSTVLFGGVYSLS